MARPLQDGSRVAPTTAGSGIPTFPVGGTVALPPPARRPPPTLSSRVNGVYRCGQRQEFPESRSSDLRGSGQPRSWDEAATELNGHLRRSVPSLEQAIGARLRQMGDQFHHEHVQREPRQQGALWGHLYHFVFQLLGILNNLPVEGIVAAAAFRPN